MDKLISAPPGLTDAEESEWWYEQRETVNAEIGLAFAEGRVKRRAPDQFERTIGASRLATNRKHTPIQLEAEDAEKAQVLADRKGISYQAYVQKLIHEALEKELDAA